MALHDWHSTTVPLSDFAERWAAGVDPYLSSDHYFFFGSRDRFFAARVMAGSTLGRCFFQKDFLRFIQVLYCFGSYYFDVLEYCWHHPAFLYL